MRAPIFKHLLSAAALAALPLSFASAQSGDQSSGLSSDIGTGITESALLLSDRSEPVAEQPLLLPVVRIERQTSQADLQGFYSDQTTDVSLGIELNPSSGLSLRAGVWQVQDRQLPLQAGSQAERWQPRQSTSLLEDGNSQEFILDQPFGANNLESRGIDLGASYVWDTGKAGTFTLETTATYIDELEQRGDLIDSYALLGDSNPLPGTADLQGSLTLTWQFGNHSAKAVTNYFDSFKDISELNVEDINRLVENITTFDLQYGYNVKTGKKDRAVISFSLGIRNIFDRKTTQILNQNSRVIDQNGRVAYGSIKYQF